MTFFGLTHLGYQNPVGDKIIVNQQGASAAQDVSVNVRGELAPSLQEHQGPLRGADMSKMHPQAFPYSSDTRHKSHKKYKEMLKKPQGIKPPNQLYVMPLTDNQQYGWMVSDSPEPWMQVNRFPRKLSDITKFVEEMTKTGHDFSTF